jgi:hypothetical protein
MAAVAHNPAFAKRVGIPQSVGKDFNEADKMKRRKFADGGGISARGMAYREARKKGIKTFMFNGKSYTTESAEEAAARKKTAAERDSDAASGRQAVRTAETFRKPDTDYRSMKTPGYLGDMTDNIGASRDSSYDLSNAPTPMSDKLKLGTNMKKGGKVKMESKVASYFAKKDEKKLAAHERREAAGKEEDTKSIAKREETALKGAPKSMKDYEHKEHKAMGFKKGGMPKSRKGKGINPAMLAALAGAGGPPRGTGGPPPGMGGPPPGMGGPPPGMGGPPPGMGMKKGGMTGKQLSKTNTENKGGTSKIGGGIESKGATKTRVVSTGRAMGIAKTGTRPAKMYAKGGGIESKGKTRGRFC